MRKRGRTRVKVVRGRRRESRMSGGASSREHGGKDLKHLRLSRALLAARHAYRS